MRKKKTNEKKKKMGTPPKVKVRPSAKRLADRKADVKAPSARSRKATGSYGGRRSRGTGK